MKLHQVNRYSTCQALKLSREITKNFEKIAKGLCLLKGTAWKFWSREGSFVPLTEDIPMGAGWQTAPGTL